MTRQPDHPERPRHRRPRGDHGVGHTSRTGSEQTDNALSLQRAEHLRQRLATEAPQLGPRLKVAGMGFRQNVIGSGTDNAFDALDRRVELKIVACG